MDSFFILQFEFGTILVILKALYFESPDHISRICAILTDKNRTFPLQKDQSEHVFIVVANYILLTLSKAITDQMLSNRRYKSIWFDKQCTYTIVTTIDFIRMEIATTMLLFWNKSHQHQYQHQYFKHDFKLIDEVKLDRNRHISLVSALLCFEWIFLWLFPFMRSVYLSRRHK